MMNTQSAHIVTFGCQMNERDSEIMAQLLAEDYIPTSALESADVIVVNTCSIREKAEQKAFSLLGRLRRMKRQRPNMLIAVAGCVAQQQKEAIRQRMPHVDVVIGPQQIYSLPELLQAARQQEQIRTDQKKDFVIPAFLPDIRSGNSFKRFVTIMQGCNNFCTYCVVPFTRGREISRNPQDILHEIKHLASHGIKEVTLLGQNVNSYGNDRAIGEQLSFAGLIREVAAIDGIERIRFTTSHPKDLSDELIECFASLDKLCPHIHLPVQSGSDRVLKRMNRRYTISQYLGRVTDLIANRPDIVITTDLIVGFPGETEADFALTMDLLEKVRYHSSFSFKYSDRPQAKAAVFPDKVDEPTKTKRLEILQKRQEEITVERNSDFIGRRMAVMVEGDRRNGVGQWTGRTMTNHIVNFAGEKDLTGGQTVEVFVEEACLHSLRGRMM
ncbi:MAG: tRNA (N6-isopentenyl adenosine(37)-C2)-methylthiotransferase MiaB [Deltaproteobacteria bacterium]